MGNADHFLNEREAVARLDVSARQPVIETPAQKESDPLFFEAAARRCVSQRGIVMCRHDRCDEWREGKRLLESLIMQFDPQVSKGAAVSAIVDVGACVRMSPVIARANIRNAG